MSRARQRAPKKKKTKVAASAKRSRGGGGGIRISTLQKKYGLNVGAARPAVQTAKMTMKQPKKKVAKKLRKKLAVELLDKQALLSSMFPEPLLNLLQYLARKNKGEEDEEEEPRRSGGGGGGGWGGGSDDVDYYHGWQRVPGEPDPVVTDVWCPECRHKLSPREVVEGFESGSIDYRTTCPSCEHRFQTTFAFAKNPGFRFVWLCDEQTRDQYDLWRSEREPFLQYHDEVDDIVTSLMTERPEIFFNAYTYGSAEHDDPKQRVAEFLGIGKEPEGEKQEEEKEEESDEQEEEEEE